MKKPAKRSRHDRRIYNAAASGARQLFEYVSNFLEGDSPKCEAPGTYSYATGTFDRGKAGGGRGRGRLPALGRFYLLIFAGNWS